MRALRTARGLSQQELVRPGLSFRTLQQLEAGRTDPRVSTLRLVAAGLGVGMGELFEEAPKAR